LVRDEENGRGPLQGLATGLTALQEHAEAAYVSACDVPLLRPAFVRRLIELLGQNDLCMPHAGGHHHPLAAVYRLEVLKVVRILLADNRCGPYDLLGQVTTRVVEGEDLTDVDATLQSLRNLNTPEDYEEALHASKRLS
jgi:molybdopterin-guanine dinucleotide biosynthesis protein A